MKKKILFIINDPAYFVLHRLPIAIAAYKQGYEIHLAGGHSNLLDKIHDLKFQYHFIPISRSGHNIFTEAKTLISLYWLMRQLKPLVVHLITIKPVLYGALSARLAKIPGVVAAITGLGYVFTNQQAKTRLLRRMIVELYRHAFRHENLKVLFENADDENALLSLGVLTQDQAILIRGGVDLTQFVYSSEPEILPHVVVLASRLLKDKGVVEYVEAAKLLKKSGLNVRFLLAGDIDPGNPSSLDEVQIQKWVRDQDIEYIGYQDTATLFSQVHIVVLPSYREGLPRVLIEAAACGRAVVTTDVPGCRDAITPNKTGLLVKAQDAKALAEGIRTLITNSAMRKEMGIEGRKLAETEFDIKKIVSEHMQVYSSLQSSKDNAIG